MEGIIDRTSKKGMMRELKNLDPGELEQAQYLLERMLDLAEISAGDRCSDERRKTLQKGFAFLREEVLRLMRDKDEEDV